MAQRFNPISASLTGLGISVPDVPVDFSRAFRAAGVRRTYLICITGRCGSTWLAHAMAQLPHCGNPLEYFSEEAIPHYGRPDGSGDLLQYVQTVAEDRQTAGAFGLKIDGMRLEWLSQICDLRQSFSPDSTAWVDMRRLNLVKQAFSFARAKATGIWHSLEASGDSLGKSMPVPPTPASPVTDTAVWHEIMAIIRTERLMDRTYAELGVQPLRIFYEELLDSKRHILQRLLVHCFPRRVLRITELEFKDATQKLAGAKEDGDELAFLERHSILINNVYKLRRDYDADLQEFDALIKSEVTVT